MIAGIVALTLSAPPSFLQVKGNRLVYLKKDADIRGVCVGDIILARRYRPLNDYHVIASEWKANAVRIGVSPTSWNSDGPQKVMNVLKAEVGAALREGMFVFIDWHTIGWPDRYTETISNAPADLYDSRLSVARSFWKEAARAFKDEGRVAFSMWNEPAKEDAGWQDALGKSWIMLRHTWIDLTQIVRHEGARNLLLFSGGRWSYDLRGVKDSLLPDANTAYQWHVYAGHGNNDPAQWDYALDGLQKVKPVIVSEWGFQEDSDEHFKGDRVGFGDPFVNFMNERGLYGLAWCWHDTWTPVMLEHDFKTPTSFGRFIKEWLATGTTGG